MSPKGTILILDETEVLMRRARTVLREAGYRVTTRSGALHFVGAMLTSQPDLVLLTLSMPIRDGEAVVYISPPFMLTPFLAAWMMAFASAWIVPTQWSFSSIWPVSSQCGIPLMLPL